MKTPSSLKGFKSNLIVISLIQEKFSGKTLKYQEAQEKLGISANSAYYHLNQMVVDGKAEKLNKFLYKISIGKAKIKPEDLIPDDFSGYVKKQAWIAAKNKELYYAAHSAAKIVGQVNTSKLQFIVTDTHSTNATSAPIKFEPATLSKSIWRDKWELEDLNLQRECADFYTAYDICSTAEGQGIRDLYLEPIVARLSKQFANYLDMALGGELRHCSHKMNSVISQMNESPVHTAVLGKAKSGGSRHDMWLEWHAIRKEFGIEALKVARDSFLKGSWSSAFGGKKWGLAASILVQYLEGEINSVIFVDTVWSLQHNTSWILNKVWQIPANMKQLLDDKFAGRIEKVVPYANPELQEAWKFEVRMRQVDENIRRVREEQERGQAEGKKRGVAILAGILKVKAKRDAEIQVAKAIQMLAEAQEVLNA